MSKRTKETIQLVKDRYHAMIPSIENKLFELKKSEPNIDEKLERKYAELILLLQTHKINTLDYLINCTVSDATSEDKTMLYITLHMFHDMQKMFDEGIQQSQTITDTLEDII